MKEIKLIKLKLKNFKGIKNFELDLQGENASIYANNGEGKTTLFDAFSWLLFDKDSKGQSTFDIKTLDEDGQVIHNLEHQVEGVLDINDKKLTLRKSYYEKWTKKRGVAKETFSGHTTDYFINEVPVKKSEYEDRISEIVDEEIFKLVTNPAYFNDLHWQERRKVLLEVCGGITNQDVIDQNDDLKKLEGVLRERTLEEHQKVIASKRREINKELGKIPIRIDEVTQGVPDVDNLDKKELTLKLADKEEEKKTLQKSINRIESGGEVAEKTKELREIESEIIDVKNQAKGGADEEVESKRNQLEQVRSKYRERMVEGEIKKGDIKSNNATINRLQDNIKTLYAKWDEVDGRKFVFEQDDTCPTCSQPIPLSQLEETKKKSLAKFNREQAEGLESITKKGKTIRAEIEGLESQSESIKEEIEALEKEVQEYQKEAEKIKTTIDNLSKQGSSLEDNSDYKIKLEEKESLERTIENLKGDKSEELQEVNREVQSLQSDISTLNSQMAKFEQYEKAQERIKELSEKEKELAIEFDKLEEQLYLCEQFIKTKVNLLEENINDKFKYAHFKLFEEQVNGGVKECCETLYEGVPYSSALNNGARINVGLDIIDTLSKYHKFKAPIFIDNAESVTEIMKVDSQMIKLLVSPNHQRLSVIKDSDLADDSQGITDLRALASNLNVRNYSNYKKEELIKEINKKIIEESGINE